MNSSGRQEVNGLTVNRKRATAGKRRRSNLRSGI